MFRTITQLPDRRGSWLRPGDHLEDSPANGTGQSQISPPLRAAPYFCEFVAFAVAWTVGVLRCQSAAECRGLHVRPQYAHAVAETSYAPCGDLSLAYQVFGDGPIELVFVGRAVGPVPRVRSMDDRAAEIEAVMDAVGFENAAVFGLSEGGPASIVFAAERPERTRALILLRHVGVRGSLGWEDLERDPAEVRARLLPELDEDYTPSAEQIARLMEVGRAVRSAWGSGAAMKGLVPSVRSIRQLAMLERMSASPGMARATLEAGFRIDVRPILPTITAPTLVIHARDDPAAGAVRPVPRRTHPRRAIA